MVEPKGQPAAMSDEALRDLLPDEADLLYEEELLRNPYNLKMWLRYLGARKGAPAKKRYVLYERALQALPGSFKVCEEPKKIAACTTLRCGGRAGQGRRAARHHLQLVAVLITSPLPHCSCGMRTWRSASRPFAAFPSTTPRLTR